jgi:DNA-binding XRE family transcriptional regulator
VADAEAGTPAADIHKWLSEADYCLLFLEDRMPTPISNFRRLRQNCERKVANPERKFPDRDWERKVTHDELPASKSAYTPDEIDGLVDFRFGNLEQINGILKFAATKLEIEGLSVPKLGQELYAARQRAGHSQREAGKTIGYDHHAISEWETGKREPLPDQAKNIWDYILKYPEKD